MQTLDYRVLVAANADEVSRLLGRNVSIDVLPTDTIMLTASGAELIRRRIERWPMLKVIYMSGYTDRFEEGLITGGFTTGGRAVAGAGRWRCGHPL